MSLVSRIKNLSKEKNLNLKLLEEQAGFGKELSVDGIVALPPRISF